MEPEWVMWAKRKLVIFWMVKNGDKCPTDSSTPFQVILNRRDINVGNKTR